MCQRGPAEENHPLKTEQGLSSLSSVSSKMITCVLQLIRLSSNQNPFQSYILQGERHPLNFGREVTAELAGVPERADWKNCQVLKYFIDDFI